MNYKYNIFGRIIFLMSINTLFMGLLAFSIFKISSNKSLEEFSNQKNFYKLKIKSPRGMIYDCNGMPLIKNKKKLLASIIPNKINFIDLINATPEDKKKEFIKKYYEGLPFVSEVSKNIIKPGVQIFEVLEQVFDSSFACHTIGYLKENHGICGIEKSFDDLLSDIDDIEIEYQQNAAGQIITERNYDFNYKSYINSQGVQLCLDKRIQDIAEEISNKYISKGAVLITEVPDCRIRASVSIPSFAPNLVKFLINSKNSDLINRVNCQYNLGSIFKLATTAYLLESGLVSENELYNCKGAFEFEDGKRIRCFHGIAHGEINLEKAISLSCNSMFAKFSHKINPKLFIEFVKSLGFGKEINLAPDMVSKAGNLPNLCDLEDEKKMAMFSFGQESLLVTPLQVASLINTIASEGLYYYPRLVEGTIDKEGKFNNCNISLPKRILKFSTSMKLKKFMKSCITSGTGKYGNPKNIESGAKTSTAETGIFIDGKRIDQSWFAGFFPFENPKYCIVVLSENANPEEKVCGLVFKEIVEKISDLNNNI